VCESRTSMRPLDARWIEPARCLLKRERVESPRFRGQARLIARSAVPRPYLFGFATFGKPNAIGSSLASKPFARPERAQATAVYATTLFRLVIKTPTLLTRASSQNRGSSPPPRKSS